jgi:hypothetical protein
VSKSFAATPSSWLVKPGAPTPKTNAGRSKALAELFEGTARSFSKLEAFKALVPKDLEPAGAAAQKAPSTTYASDDE